MSESDDARRQERTLTVDHLLSVVIKTREPGEKIMALVTDNSQKGLQVSIPREIEPGTEVEVFFTMGQDDENLITKKAGGVVRWCRPNELVEVSYDAGIELKKKS